MNNDLNSEVSNVVSNPSQIEYQNIQGNVSEQNFYIEKLQNYPFGIMPEGRSYTVASASYSSWKDSYVTSDGAQGLRRVKGGLCRSTVSDCTTSEGVGYGMLLAVNFNDKALFDDLWGYYDKYKNGNGLMKWRISADGSVISDAAKDDNNSATDGDEDVAFALILADEQWGSDSTNYRQDAIDLSNHILNSEVEVGTYVLKPSDGWGGSNVTNPSYFAPAYYRAFQILSGDEHWANIIDKSYDILSKAANSTTGLVPDWCKADGTTVDGKSYAYGYDAVRTPLRIAMDYLWNGEPKALAFSRKIADFATGIGIANIKDGYDLNGTPTGQWHNSAFVGSFATAALATDTSYQAFANDAYAKNVELAGDNCYNWSIRTLSLLLQTGNMLYPVPTTTTTTTEATTTTSTTEETTTTTTTTPVNSSISLQVSAGWSLLSSTIGFDAATIFCDSSTYASVWKWGNGVWSVYIPNEVKFGAYATSKGFSQLTTINPGDGFWVNATHSSSMTISGTPVYGNLTFTSGWNLVGLKSAQSYTVQDFIAGKSGIASLWKWENGVWAVHLPGEVSPGAYAASKGFGTLGSINPCEGFWVNTP